MQSHSEQDPTPQAQGPAGTHINGDPDPRRSRTTGDPQPGWGRIRSNVAPDPALGGGCVASGGSLSRGHAHALARVHAPGHSQGQAAPCAPKDGPLAALLTPSTGDSEEDPWLPPPAGGSPSPPRSEALSVDNPPRHPLSSTLQYPVRALRHLLASLPEKPSLLHSLGTRPWDWGWGWSSTTEGAPSLVTSLCLFFLALLFLGQLLTSPSDRTWDTAAPTGSTQGTQGLSLSGGQGHGSSGIPGEHLVALPGAAVNDTQEAQQDAAEGSGAGAALTVAPGCRPRRQSDTALAVRTFLGEMGLEPLNETMRERLGTPCSLMWIATVLGYYRENAGLQKIRSAPDFARGIRSMCRGLQVMEESLAEDPGCAWEGSAAGAETGRAGEGAEAEHDWGTCWPNGRPWSSGVKPSDLTRAKFLVPAMNVEQLSKAKMHLSEAARLARRTGRILVVPPASESRITAGRSLPACNYLSFDSLASPEVPLPAEQGATGQMMGEGGAEWISSDIFYMLLGRFLPHSPRVSFLCFEARGYLPCVENEDVASVMEHILGLSYGATPQGNNNTAHVRMFWGSRAVGISRTRPEEPVDLIAHRMAEADIVVLLKVTPCLINFTDPDPETHSDVVLPYAVPFQKRAERIIALLGKPYIAVHFRSEFILWQKMRYHRENDTEWQMMRCAQNALALAKSKAEEIGAKHVFIAADVPSNVSSSALRSESWAGFVSTYGIENSLVPAAKALQALREGIPNSISIEELDPTALSLDPGMLSIIDKLVLSSASVFIAGEKNCGGGHAFEADVLRRRARNHIEPQVIRWRN